MDLLALLSMGNTGRFHLDTHQGSMAKQVGEAIARRGQEASTKRDILRRDTTRRAFTQSRSTHHLCHHRHIYTTNDSHPNIIEETISKMFTNVMNVVVSI